MSLEQVTVQQIDVILSTGLESASIGFISGHVNYKTQHYKRHYAKSDKVYNEGVACAKKIRIIDQVVLEMKATSEYGKHRKVVE